MNYKDDRTAEQVKTHTILIAMTDRFLSGWGAAKGGKSYAAWACEPKHADKVFDWVSSRSDALRVRIVNNSWNPRGVGHVHIYIVTDKHPAITG